MNGRETLLYIRARGGLTKPDLACLADVAVSTIRRKERGELEPTDGTMSRIRTASGYTAAGPLVSAGSLSAVAAARYSLGELSHDDLDAEACEWLERWCRCLRGRYSGSEGGWVGRKVDRIPPMPAMECRPSHPP